MESQVRLVVDLKGGKNAPQKAREELGVVREAMSDSFDKVALLASELVTNAVRHTKADSIEFAVTARPEVVRVEVASPGPGLTVPSEPKPTAHGGFGLFLVDELADRWGVHENGVTRVWFELAPG
jgi:anti-sigma regulatory factor (Ser/Thr protein kinase)